MRGRGRFENDNEYVTKSKTRFMNWRQIGESVRIKKRGLELADIEGLELQKLKSDLKVRKIPIRYYAFIKNVSSLRREIQQRS